MSISLELLDYQVHMDTDNQSNLLLYTNSNREISLVDISKTDHLMELHDANGLLNTVAFILLNDHKFKSSNVENNQDQLTDSEKQRFVELQKGCEDQHMLFGLIAAFTNFYKIYLHIIGCRDGRFKIINEYYHVNGNKPQKQAFVVLNGDNTIRGPLFAHNLTGRKQTVFAFDDITITNYVDKYLEILNQTNPRLFPLIDVQPCSNILQECCNEISGQPKKQMKTSAADDQVIQKIINTYNTSSILNTISSIVQESGNNINIFDRTSSENIQNLQNVTQAAAEHRLYNHESNRVMEADLNSGNITIPLSIHLSTATDGLHIVRSTTSTQYLYGEPEILIQPKQEWNVRYLKDLIPKMKKERKKKKTNGKLKKKRTRPNKEKKTKFIGILQGDGRQRSRIQVKVSSEETRKIYLGSAVRTLNNQHHRSKVIVQAETKVNKDLHSHENNLNCLEFDECNPMHHFDPDTRNVYMEITSTEHAAGCKEVPLYMFNLNQNQRITKEMIKHEQLDKCILAFWLCVKENENYVPVSPSSLSCIITEKKKIKTSSKAAASNANEK